MSNDPKEETNSEEDEEEDGGEPIKDEATTNAASAATDQVGSNTGLGSMVSRCFLPKKRPSVNTTGIVVEEGRRLDAVSENNGLELIVSRYALSDHPGGEEGNENSSALVPAKQPHPSRGRSNRLPGRSNRSPGAYAVVSVRGRGEREERRHNNTRQTTQIVSGATMEEASDVENLAMATPVLSDFPVATPERASSNRDDFLGQPRSRHWVYLLVLLLISGLLVALGLSARFGNRLWGNDPTRLRQGRIREAILEVFGEDYFDNSQKERALHWIVFGDPQQQGLATEAVGETSNNNLVQRFVLASFYFETSSRNPWPYCNPPAESGQSDLCYYLVAEYSGRPMETQGTRWLTAAHECQWMGIQCTTETREVTNVDFMGRNLTGEIPSALSRLSKVTTLDFRDNHLLGSLPTWVLELSSLESIKLDDNDFLGPIPTGYFSLEALTLLQLARNRLTGTIPVNRWSVVPRLRILCLQGNQLASSVPPELYSLTTLTDLVLSNNTLTGSLSSDVSKLSGLQHVYLGGNKLFSGTIPSQIGNLRRLSTLDLARTGIDGTIPDALYSLSNLERLQLSGSRIAGTISSRIGLLTHLQTFYVADTRISGTLPEELSNLSFLDHLRINQNSNLVGSIPLQFCANKARNYHSLDIVADCAPSVSTGAPAMVCSKGCCTQCCDAETKICLNT